MFRKVNLTLHSRMSGSRWVITPLCLPGSWTSVLYSSSVHSCHHFLISSGSVRSLPFLSFTLLTFAWNVPFSSLAQLCPTTPWTTAHQASLSITNLQSLLKLMSIVSVMPPNHLILCHPLLLLPSNFSSIRVFSNELALQVDKVLELQLQLQHQSFQWIFRTDFL